MPPTPYGAPRRAAPSYIVPPDEEDNVESPEEVVQRRSPVPTGTTGGITVQQAGTWDRPAPGRLDDDPEVRAAQSAERAQQAFEDKQRADNPFIYSGALKSLAKEGGRRYIDAAVRQGDRQYQQQVQSERQAAKLDTAAYNSRMEARFRGNGQQFYTDPLTKRVMPVIEPDTGKALYHQTDWAPSTHPKTGLAVFERRDKYGQRQYKRPTLSDSVDPSDEYLYADMGDGESTPYITKAEAAKSRDVSLAKIGLAALKKQRTTQAQESLARMSAVDQAIDAEVLEHNQAKDDIQRQIDELSAKATNSGDTDINRQAYQSRIEQLNGELQKHIDATHAGSELMRRQRLSKKSIALHRAQSALDAYQIQKQEIEARLRGQGVPESDFEKDPVYRSNLEGMRAMEEGVRGGQSALKQEEALNNRLSGARSFDTKLSPAEEQAFQQWRARMAPNDSGADYDLRGAFKAGLSPGPDGHWPDTFKKPNHPTFSNESVYAKDAPERAGRWNGNQFVPPNDLAAGEPGAAAARGVDRIGGVGIQEFARRYGSGEGEVRPDSLLRLNQRSREIDETLASDQSTIDDKLRNSLTQEKQYVDALYKQRLARLPPEDQQRVQDAVALANEGGAKTAAKSFARGASAEGLYAASEGLSRFLEMAGNLGATPAGVGAAGKWYADATKKVREDIRKALPIDEKVAQGLNSQISQGLGQAAGTLPLAALGPEALAGASVGQIYDEAYQDAKQSGASDEQAHSAAVKYLPAAALDYLSNELIVGRIMKPLVGRATVGMILKDILTSAASEGITEGAQQAYLNQIASKLEGYDPNRPFDQEVYDSMLVGAVTGGVATAAGQAGHAAMERDTQGGNVENPRQPAPPSDRTGDAGDVSEIQAAEAEFQRRLSELTPAERAQVEAMAAEPVATPPKTAAEAARELGQPRVARSAEDVAGIFERNAPQVEEPRAPIKSAADAAQTLEQVRATEYSPGELRPSTAEEAAAVLSREVPQVEPDAPAPARESAAALLEAQARQRPPEIDPAARAMAGPEEGGLSPEQVARQEALFPTETPNEQVTRPISDERSRPDAEVPARESQQPTPDVSQGEVVAAGRPPVTTDPAAIAKDRREYDVLNRRMQALIKQGKVGSPEFQSAWGKLEAIKNRHGGMPPGEVSAESASTKGESTNAIQERSPAALGEQPERPQGSREQGSGRVEQGQQGHEAARKGVVQPSDIQQAERVASSELKKNNAGLGMKPVSALSQEEKRAELSAAGITTYNGKPIAEANPAQLSNAVGKLRRGELTAEGEKPGATQPLLTERAEAALKKMKLQKPGETFAHTPFSLAYDSAIDLAILGVRAARPVEQVIRIAVARFKAQYPKATEQETAKLESDIRKAISAQPTPPSSPKKKESLLTQSAKAAGAPVAPIEYEVRRQEERKQEASDFIKKNGKENAEAALNDKSLPGDTRVAIGGQLINDKMLELLEAKTAAETAKATQDIRRITAAMQPSLATEAGQQISMFSALYKDMRVASAMEYTRDINRARAEKLGGEDGLKAADEAAQIFNNKELTPEQRDKEIERLKERFTTKPVRKMLNEFKRMETAKKLNELDVLTRDDMIEVAGNALGIPGISQQKLKHLSEIANRIETAKNPAERVKAELELADTLSAYKGINPLDLESSILTLNILSGPTTQLANLEGNALNSIAQLGTTALANPTKLPQLVSGLIDGMGLGKTEARSILQTGRGTRDFQDKTSLAGSALATVDYARDFPKTGPAANALTARARFIEKISRFMRAADAVFYYPAREAYARLVTTKLLESKFSGKELDEQVRKYLHITPEQLKSAEAAAKAEGYEGIDLARRTSDIIEERRAQTPVGAQAVKESERFAAEATYNQEPEGLAGVIYRNAANLVQQARIGGVPVLKPWLMFLRVPANVFNATTNFTPMGAIRAEFGMQGAKPGERRNFTKDERNRLYLQSIIGSSLMGALIYRVLEKDDIDVTAGGPVNPTQRKQLQTGGWMPYSIKVGDKYYSYKDSPLLVPLSIVGNVADSVKYQKAKQDMLLESKVANAVAQAPQVIFQTSMLSGLADLMKGLSGPGDSGLNTFGRTLGSVPANLVIPYNRLLQQIDQVFDPKQYEAGPVKRAIPFLRREGEVRTDVQGRPETYNPFDRFGSPESKDPLDVLIRDKQVFVPDVATSQKIGNRTMTDEERNRFRQLSGQRIRARLNGMVPTLRGMDKEKAQDTIDRISREERDRAKSMIGRMSVNR